MRWVWVIALLVFASSALAEEAKAPDFARFYPYEEARALAQAHDRILLLYFRSLSCPYCKQMETFVLGDPEVVETLAQCYVVGMITLERPEGQALFKAYKVVGTPTFLWLKPRGEGFEELNRVVGSRTKEAFLALLKRYCQGGEDG